jgi:hypothetical protein
MSFGRGWDASFSFYPHAPSAMARHLSAMARHREKMDGRLMIEDF